jgi:hypothetical protein
MSVTKIVERGTGYKHYSVVTDRGCVVSNHKTKTQAVADAKARKTAITTASRSNQHPPRLARGSQPVG